jgi:hypothetical protein
MFRRAWWTRRRIVVAAVLAVSLTVAVVWECGTEEVREGQPLDEARAALQRAGAVDVSANCGMFRSVGGHYEVSNSYWRLPDGRTIYLMSSRESEREPFRIDSFIMWQGWYKSSAGLGQELPTGEAVHFRRSVLTVVPSWFR